MNVKNPTNEVFYFKHNNKPLAYILMSHQVDKNGFYELFNDTTEITETELDELIELKNYEVVMVGDDKIIDEFFTEPKK